MVLFIILSVYTFIKDFSAARPYLPQQVNNQLVYIFFFSAEH